MYLKKTNERKSTGIVQDEKVNVIIDEKKKKELRRKFIMMLLMAGHRCRV
jgi:hypothetical protein